MVYGVFVTLLYFYIGYTYMCWVKYRHGAGFDVNDVAILFVKDIWFLVLIAWPFVMIIHTGVNIYDKFNLETLYNKISPESFYDRGVEDNDINKQAEKHLLGGK